MSICIATYMDTEIYRQQAAPLELDFDLKTTLAFGSPYAC